MTLKERTIRSFAGLLALFVLMAGFWHWSRTREDDQGIPWPFRKGLEFTDRVGRSLFRTSHVAASPPSPARGAKPRVNGDLGLGGSVDANTWRMSVETDAGDEKDERPIELSLADFKTLPRTASSADFFCIEGWKDTFAYSGVKFSDFLKRYHLGKKPGTDTYYAYVGLETPDGGYYVSIDMESMLHPQTLLADEMNGAPLSLENGAPLRLVIPVKYGIKSLKRIGKIVFSDTRPADYWAEQGYDWFAGL